MAYISSYLFPGVTIMQPLPNAQTNTINIQLGPDEYGGIDPRGNNEIMQSLRQAGKLIGIAASADILPHSMAGYELYSWQQDGRWNFTLVTGTDRGKTTEEIAAASNSVTPDGWVQIHVVGVDAIKTVLARLPQNEDVFWLSRPQESNTLTGIDFGFPPKDIIAEINALSQRDGFNLMSLELS